MNRGKLAGFCAALFQVAIGGSALGANIVWTNVSGGNWSVAANWSPNQVPTITDSAFITNSGTYVVTVTTVEGVSNVFLGSSSGTQTLTLSSGSLNASNISTRTTNGDISLAGGTIANAKITLTNGTSLVVNNGTLNGVTMSGTLDVGASVDAAVLTVTNGLVLNGTALVGNPTNNNYGYITFEGSQTLGGSGTVIFGEQSSYTYNALRLADAGTTLTIGSAMTVEGQNGTIGYSSTWGGPANVLVINQGVISANVSGGTISIQAEPFINEAVAQGINGGSLTIDVLQNNSDGTVTLNGAGSLSLTGVWTNLGAINATNATVDLGGGFTLATLGTLTRSGGTVNLTGVLTNTGTTLALTAATGTWVLDGGMVLGGTITTAGGASLVVNNGTFNGVTMGGTLDVGASINAADLTVTNGLVLNGMALVGNPTNNNYGYITFEGSQTLGGSGTVIFGEQSSYTYNALRLADAGTTLTIGSAMTVEGQNGTIGYSSTWGGPANVLVINQGVISANVSGGTISIQAEPFINEAVAQGINGGSLTIDVLQNNSDGTVTLNGAGSLSLTGVWTNLGAINATNATVDLGGGFTLATLGTLTRSGGTVNLTGVLTNTGTTLALTAATGTWVLDGGMVLGGTITTAGGASLVVNNGTFNGVTMGGTLDVGASVDSADLTVTNGLVLNGTALVGNPTNNNYGYITFEGSQTLGGSGTVIFGEQSSYTYNALRLADAGTTLTIGSAMTVEGQNGTIGYSSTWGGPANVLVINQGVISANVSGGTISIQAEPFINEAVAQGINGGSLTIDVLQNNSDGTVTLNGAGSLSLTGVWTNLGAINATNATVDLGGGFTLATLGTLTRSGGTVNLTGVLTNTGTTLALTAATGTWVLDGGMVLGGTITTAGGASLVVNNGTFNGVTMGGTLDVGASINAADLTVTNGLVLNGTALVGNPTNNNYGYITFEGSQTLGGSGTVIFGEQSSYTYNALRLADAGTTLTIGSAMTVEGQNGTIGYSSTWGGPANVLVINQGVISANVSGGTISIQAEPFINEAVAQGINGGSLTIDVLQNNSDGTVTLNGAGSLSLTGVWTNLGAINATNATVDLGGGFTLATLGTLTRSGGTVNLTGVLTNTGTTLALTAATGTWVLDGGMVLGGTITTAGGASLVVNNGTFNGVTMGGTLDVGASVDSADLTVTNGLVLNGTALVGNPTNNNYGYITFEGSQTLGGSGTVIFGEQSSYTYNALRLADAGTTLTIGSAMTVEGQNGTIGYSSTWGGPANVLVINQGIISANVSGGTILLDATPFDNNGTLAATPGTAMLTGSNNLGGGTLEFGLGSMNSYGKIQISGSAALAGTVAAILLNGFTPAVSNSFPVLTYGSFTGAFSSTALPSGFIWQTNYGPTTFTLTASGTGPVLKSVLNPSAPFLLQFTGSTNAEYTVLASTNVAAAISNWVTLGNATVLSNTLYQFIDTNSTNFRQRFYILRSP